MPQIITLPLQFIVDFYYYYSTAALIICWMIAPFLFYIIFTQSKNLNSLKWLILNHSFWCLALETLFGLVKPLFFSPLAGGIQLGKFKNFGDFRNTAAAALIFLAICSNCIGGLCVTITSRYLYAYSSILSKYFTLKTQVKFMIGTAFSSYLLIIITFYSLFLVEPKIIHQWAVEYDPILSNFFKKPSFFLVPHFLLDRVIPVVLVINVMGMLSFILLSIYFIYQVRKNQTISTTRFQKSLIISSIVQIYLTIIFLMFPLFMFFLFITFDIPNSATAMCLLTSLIMTHCLMEFVATLYFISPYRKFITKFFKKRFYKNVCGGQKVSQLRF